jgi:hypothetical protein
MLYESPAILATFSVEEIIEEAAVCTGYDHELPDVTG